MPHDDLNMDNFSYSNLDGDSGDSQGEDDEQHIKRQVVRPHVKQPQDLHSFFMQNNLAEFTPLLQSIGLKIKTVGELQKLSDD